MTNYQPYLDLIEQHYPLRCEQYELLQVRMERIVLKLQTSLGAVVAKINTDPAQADRIERDLRFLQYVTDHGLNYPPLIRINQAQAGLRTDDLMLYLLHFIPGQPPTPSPHFFQQAGRLLGRLHSLPVTDQTARTDFSLASELPYIRSCKAQIEHWPDAQLENQLEKTLVRLAAMEPVRQALVHSDFFIGNMITRPDGELYLIDLDDAGVSDPLLDVGYFIGNGILRETNGLVTFDLTELSHFLRAYLAERPLTQAEFALLPDYLYFGVVLYLCDPAEKAVWALKASRYRWLLAHEDWLREQLAAYQSN